MLGEVIVRNIPVYGLHGLDFIIDTVNAVYKVVLQYIMETSRL